MSRSRRLPWADCSDRRSLVGRNQLLSDRRRLLPESKIPTMFSSGRPTMVMTRQSRVSAPKNVRKLGSYSAGRLLRGVCFGVGNLPKSKKRTFEENYGLVLGHLFKEKAKVKLAEVPPRCILCNVVEYELKLMSRSFLSATRSIVLTIVGGNAKDRRER